MGEAKLRRSLESKGVIKSNREVIAMDTQPKIKDDRLTRDERTPAAAWREEGKPDPHEGAYDCRRFQLAGGKYTDDEIAFQCGTANGRGINDTMVLMMAKERIRWLSRQLVAAEEKIKDLENKNR